MMNRENIYDVIRTYYHSLESAGYSADSQELSQGGEFLLDNIDNPLIYSLYAPKPLLITVNNLQGIWYDICSKFTTDDNIRTWLDIHNDVVLRITKPAPPATDDDDNGFMIDEVDRNIRGYVDICKDHSSCCRRCSRIDHYSPVIFDDKHAIGTFGDFASHVLSLVEGDQTWVTKFQYFKVTFHYYLGTCHRYEFADEIHSEDYVVREFCAVTVNNLFSFRWLLPSDLSFASVCNSTTDALVTDHQFRAPHGGFLLPQYIPLFGHWYVFIDRIDIVLAQLMIRFFGKVYETEIEELCKLLHSSESTVPP